MKMGLFLTTILGWLLQISVYAAEGTQVPKDQVEMNAVANQAFQVLSNVPAKGLEQSASGIEQIIAIHRRLAKSEDSSQRYLSVVLADSVAFSIVREIHRANLTRIGITQKIVPTAIPFNKMTAIRLWRANRPDFEPLVRRSLNGNDKLLNYIAKLSSPEEVLNGRMLEKMPVGEIADYEQELCERALLPILNMNNLTPDLYLKYMLNKSQAFQDLTIVIDQYEKGDIPEESKAFRALFEKIMDQYPSRRVDDGMKAIPFKVWQTYSHYNTKESIGGPLGPADEYIIRLTAPLAPFMADTSSLPEPSQKLLNEMRRLEQKADARKKADEAKRIAPVK